MRLLDLVRAVHFLRRRRGEEAMDGKTKKSRRDGGGGDQIDSPVNECARLEWGSKERTLAWWLVGAVMVALALSATTGVAF